MALVIIEEAEAEPEAEPQLPQAPVMLAEEADAELEAEAEPQLPQPPVALAEEYEVEAGLLGMMYGQISVVETGTEVVETTTLVLLSGLAGQSVTSGAQLVMVISEVE